MRFLSVGVSAALLLTGVQSAALNTLPVLAATEDTPVVISVELCDWTVLSTDESSTLFSGQTRCYCVTHDGTNYGCNIPGPVLQFTAGETATVDFTNNLVGWSSDDLDSEGIAENVYRGMDVTNLHTHGLHVSPEDDDVLISIEPNGGQRIYNYTMPADHYFGTHWYHAHHHGSTALHVTGGLIGGLEVIGPDMSDLDDYDAHWLVLHQFYAVDSDDCNNCLNGDYRDYRSDNTDGAFRADSTCYMYCRFDPDERDASDFTYDIECSTNAEYYLVNGQVAPTIAMDRNSYVWLRLVNAMGMYYAQMQFPSECDAYLAGNDGVFFEAMRDLSDTKYGGETVMNPGSRADVFVKCDTAGVYAVTFDSDTEGGSEAHPPDDTVVFYLNVTSTDGANADLPSIPARPSYLDDLRDGSDIIEDSATDFETECPCVNFDTAEFGTDCPIDFDLDGGAGFVNEVAFNHSYPLMFVRKDAVYEYVLDNGEHPYHQHINHFQLVSDVSGGFVAQSGDWRDTLGGPGGNREVRMRFADFVGKVVLHCHFLPHEDMGMMAYYLIVDSDNITDYYADYPQLQTCGLVESDDTDDSAMQVSIGVATMTVAVNLLFCSFLFV